MLIHNGSCDKYTTHTILRRCRTSSEITTATFLYPSDAIYDEPATHPLHNRFYRERVQNLFLPRLHLLFLRRLLHLHLISPEIVQTYPFPFTGNFLHAYFRNASIAASTPNTAPIPNINIIGPKMVCATQG